MAYKLFDLNLRLAPNNVLILRNQFTSHILRFRQGNFINQQLFCGRNGGPPPAKCLLTESAEKLYLSWLFPGLLKILELGPFNNKVKMDREFSSSLRQRAQFERTGVVVLTLGSILVMAFLQQGQPSLSLSLPSVNRNEGQGKFVGAQVLRLSGGGNNVEIADERDDAVDELENLSKSEAIEKLIEVPTFLFIDGQSKQYSYGNSPCTSQDKVISLEHFLVLVDQMLYFVCLICQSMKDVERNWPTDVVEDMERRRNDPQDDMHMCYATPELQERFQKVDEELRDVEQKYLQNDVVASSLSPSVCMTRLWFLIVQRNIQKVRSRLRKEIWRRHDKVLPRQPHQIHKRQIAVTHGSSSVIVVNTAGGDRPERTYMEVFCNDHPRWIEDDGLPGHFVRVLHMNSISSSLRSSPYHYAVDTPGDGDRYLKLHWIIRNKFPDYWARRLYAEGRTVTYAIDWQPHNNTETAKAILKWFERTCTKTGDRRAMLQFRRQYNLWYTRKLSVSQHAQDIGHKVIWPIRSRRQSQMYVLQKGFRNLDEITELQKNKEYVYPIETEYVKAMERRAEKHKRYWDQRMRRYDPQKDCMVPRGFGLPYQERQDPPIKLSARVARLWEYLVQGNKSHLYSLEQLRYIAQKNLVRKAFPPDVDQVIRRGELGFRMCAETMIRIGGM
eukprot:jgi/Bigna1/80089/fgenesh1_pg.67_\